MHIGRRHQEIRQEGDSVSIQRYSANQHPIQTLMTWVQSGEIAIPEIQRPFVWTAIEVRDLIDSPYQGYAVGYLLLRQNGFADSYKLIGATR